MRKDKQTQSLLKPDPQDREHTTTRFYLGKKRKHFRMGQKTIRELEKV